MRLRRSKRAAVLGCGPAGLFAAHGLVENGWDVTIFSKKRESHLYGAQYLHEPVPGLTPEDEEPIWVDYKLTGTVQEYQQKVYGAMPVKTSVEMLERRHLAWDLRATYRAAWRKYESLVDDIELSPSVLNAPVFSAELSPIAIRTWDFDVIVSSVPLPDICYQRESHQFVATQIWAIGDAPDRDQWAPYSPAENSVECDGSRHVGWYRASNIFGHSTVEWPGRSKPPLPEVAQVIKPIYTDCVCYRDGRTKPKFVLVGRYGAWSKGVLSHQAYSTAANL